MSKADANVDLEVSIMADVWQLLSNLEPGPALRVLDYLTGRMKHEARKQQGATT